MTPFFYFFFSIFCVISHVLSVNLAMLFFWLGLWPGLIIMFIKILSFFCRKLRIDAVEFGRVEAN